MSQLGSVDELKNFLGDAKVEKYTRIRICVESVDEARTQYRVLFPQLEVEEQVDAPYPTVRFQLANTLIELFEASEEMRADLGHFSHSDQSRQQNSGAFIEGIVLQMKNWSPEPEGLQFVEGVGYLLPRSEKQRFRIYLNPSPASNTEQYTPTETAAASIRAVDHIVLRTQSANDCIRLFAESGLGIRLALDKNVPEWGGRMLFFRQGKLTLEVIEANENKPEADYFWGITYQVDDIEGYVDRLKSEGVSVSDVRKGRKPGTLVASLKSHQLAIPTLLLQASAAGASST